MQKEYYTVCKLAQVEIEEKKSKFIATVKPVSKEEEALEFIAELKKKYWDATHNVYAYVIEQGNTIQRFSDDGEPSGTAGIPVLEAIKKAELQNLVVVVTRYFGGVLLGAGGLVRAYSKSAVLGIKAAHVVKKQLCVKTSVIVEYSFLGKIQNILAKKKYLINDIIYRHNVEIIVFVPIDRTDDFLQIIDDITSGEGIIETFRKQYVCLNDKL